ncbi:MAG: tetratricopeptide repeat protein [Desulfobulbaceae bacterium]|nr:tetratricopeptide repeat protein [Desulfobulbaceae bacterium]
MLSKPTQHNGGKRWLCFFCFASSVLLYALTLTNDFVWDDHFVIPGNIFYEDFGKLLKAFTTSVWGFSDKYNPGNANYRPMMHVVNFISHGLFGLTPWGWHLTNILFHSANTVLVFLIACHFEERTPSATHTGLSFSAPVFTALFFAAHPINSEAVCWISCIPELGYSLFLLLSFYLYIQNDGNQQKLTLTSVCCYLIATLFKETALILPGLLLYYDFTKNRIKTIKLMTYLSYIGATILYFLIRKHAIHSSTYIVSGNTYQKILTIIKTFAVYLNKLVIPIKLTPFWIIDFVNSIKDISFIISLITVACFLILFVKSNHINLNVKIYLSMIFLPIIPTFFLIYNFRSGSFMNPLAERYLYLPSVGFSLLSVSCIKSSIDLLPNSANRKKIFFAICTAILCCYSFITMNRIKVWDNDITLWQTTATDFPENYAANLQLGEEYYNRQQYDIAERFFIKGKKLNYDVYRNNFNQLGLIYYRQQRLNEAEGEFSEEIERYPRDFSALYNMAHVKINQGSLQEALPFLDRALESAQNDRKPQVLNAITDVFFKLGKYCEAEQSLMHSLQLDPSNTETLKNLRYIKKFTQDTDGKCQKSGGSRK